ncbi:MAG: hypothetical protein Q7S12_04330 [bacterium]|nr:hypothetical protein [bacterium]
MTDTQQKRICSQCGTEKENSFCGSCKADTPSDINISVSETIKVRDSLRMRKLGAGIKKFLGEFLGGWFPSGDPKLPGGVDKARAIDREKNEYHEVVKKYGTDEIIHETHEQLNKHQK